MSKKEKLPPKKTTYTVEEWNQIEQAMKEEGFRNLHDYVVNMTEKRSDRTDAENRRKKVILYRSASLFSVYNEIRVGINVKENINKLMNGVYELCQELQ